MFPNLKLFATEATFAILESRHNFYSRKIQYKKHVLKDGKATRVGSFKVTPFSVGYNTPGAIGVCINTMQGKVFYVSSFKYNTEDNSEPEWMESVKYLAGSDTFALLSGSIAAEAEGYAPTEAAIGE
jgi:ribonuclease J